MLEAFNSVFGDPNWVPVVRIIQDHFEKNIIIPPVELFANCEKTSYKTFSPEDDFDLFIVHKDIAFWFPVEWYMSLAQDCDVIYANPVFIVYAKKNLNIAQQEFEPAHYQNFLNLVENIRQRPKPSKQLIFLHIPKCAGTSLANSLKSEYPHFLHLDDAGLRNIEHTFDDVDFFFGHMTRATATKRKGNLEDVVWVIVLRDPLERFLSAIKHERRKDTYTSAKWVQVAREKKIQDALEEPSALRALHASLMYLGSQTNNFLTFQQDPEKLLEDIRSFLQQDNVVFGFQEDMESLYTILADMELMTKKEVPRLNVTQNHESVESAETQEAWESLQNHLAPDYKLYADAKKIFEQRFGSILAKKRQKIFGGFDHVIRNQKINASGFGKNTITGISQGTIFMYGPYIELPPGKYTLHCNLSWEEMTKVSIDLICENGVLVSKTELIGGEDQSLEFFVKEGGVQKFEARLASNGDIEKVIFQTFALFREEI